MDINQECVFSDKSVTLEQFIEKFALCVAVKLHMIEQTNNEISQRQAYKQFGRSDVLRWIKSGQLKPIRISPGKKIYKVTDLVRLANYKQNYLL